MNRSRAGILAALLAGGVLLAHTAPVVHAQTPTRPATAPATLVAALNDPTRPPGATPAAPVATARQNVTQPASAAPSRPAALPVLQSLQRPVNGRASALVSGRLLHAGDSLGEWTLAEIGADAVLLRQGRRSLRLPLLAALERPGTGTADPPADPPPADARAPLLASAPHKEP